MPARQVRPLALGLGLTFAFAGLVQVAGALVPFRLGQPEWEIAAFGELSSILGVAAIGLAILTWLGLTGTTRVLALAALIGWVFLGVLTGVGLLAVALDIPIVLRLTDASEAAGLQFRLLTGKTLALTALWSVAFWVQTVSVSQQLLGKRG